MLRPNVGKCHAGHALNLPPPDSLSRRIGILHRQFAFIIGFVLCLAAGGGKAFGSISRLSGVISSGFQLQVSGEGAIRLEIEIGLICGNDPVNQIDPRGGAPVRVNGAPSEVARVINGVPMVKYWDYSFLCFGRNEFWARAEPLDEQILFRRNGEGGLRVASWNEFQRAGAAAFHGTVWPSTVENVLKPGFTAGAVVMTAPLAIMGGATAGTATIGWAYANATTIGVVGAETIAGLQSGYMSPSSLVPEFGVVSAELKGGSRASRVFPAEEGWVAQEMQQQMQLAAKRAGTLTYDATTKTWASSGGLVYGQGSVHGNRVLHVLDHLTPNAAGKPAHTLFNVQRNELLGLLDRAWARRGSYTTHNSGNWNYRIDMGRVIGQGGETAVNISVRPGSSEIITAFPVR
jgi:hypothetical protein